MTSASADAGREGGIGVSQHPGNGRGEGRGLDSARRGQPTLMTRHLWSTPKPGRTWT